MAYMDEMALEREKSKQAMIAGKTPMFGADTTAAMHQLGISLGVIPPGTPPSETTQVLANLLKLGPGRVKVDEAKPLQVQPLVGHTTAALQSQHRGGDEFGSIGSGIGNALQRAQPKPQAQPAVGSASSAATDAPGTNRARLSGRTPRAAEGPTYQADLAYLQERGGHHSVVKDGKIVDVPLTQAGSYKSLDPELAARLRSAGEAFEKENPGKKAKFGEFSRGNDVQKIYYDKVQATGQGKAAPPGASGHQIGASGDLPPGEFRDWLYKGNKDKHGLHFPVKDDAPHVEANPAHKQSYSNPAGAAPAAAPTTGEVPATGAAPAAAAQPKQGGSAVLAEQRKPIAQFLDGNPTIKEQMAAAAYTEDNNSREGRIAVHEAAANRINAAGRPVGDIIDPKYYAAMNDPKQRPKFEAALQKIRSDPEFRKQLYGEMDQAHKRGTNYAKLATDFGSGDTAAKSRTNSTSVGKVGGNEFFIKDKNPEVHGAGTVSANQKWKAETEAALAKPAAAAAAPAAPTKVASLGPSTPDTQASPQPSPQTAGPEDALPPAAAKVPWAESPVATLDTPPPDSVPSQDNPLEPAPPSDIPSQDNPLESETPTNAPAAAAAAAAPEPAPAPAPAPVAASPTPAPAAAAPAPPPVAAPPVPVAKPAPPAPPVAAKPAAPAVNPAHGMLDTKVIDLVRKGDPSQAGSIPGWIANKTLREAINTPMIGGAVAAEARKNLAKAGITPQQFDQALKEGTPKAAAAPAPGKRSDLGTSDATDFSSRGRTPDPNAATLDPASQPAIMNEDRTISTVGTIGVGDDGKRVNIPTVPQEGGARMTDEQAIQRYKETGNHLGKFDTREQSDAAAEALHQNEAAQIDTRDKGPQPATASPAPQPQITPEMARALNDAYKDQDRVEPGSAAPPPSDALPVLPAQPAGATPGAAGGLSLAPAGLSSIPTGALMPQPGSQGGGIAMAGMLPPIENSTYSTPLLDQAAAKGSGMGLSPIPLQTLGSWGWGGGGNIGAGLDWGGGGGLDFGGSSSMPIIGGGGW